MFKIPKKVAFAIFVLVTVMLGISFAEIDWNVVFSKSSSPNEIFKELLGTLTFVFLAIFYTIYYVSILKKDKGNMS